MGHLGSIDHFVVLMLENRSFDNLLGASGAFFLTCNMPKPAMRTRSPFYPALFVAHTHTHTHRARDERCDSGRRWRIFFGAMIRSCWRSYEVEADRSLRVPDDRDHQFQVIVITVSSGS